MNRLFAYIITSGVHGCVYAITNPEKRQISSLRIGDVLSIKGLGMLQIVNYEAKFNYTQGVREQYVYFNTNEIGGFVNY